MNVNTALSLAVAAVVTADANRAGVDISNLTGKCMLILDSTATDTVGKTLDVKLQHSADNGSTDAWTDAGVAFAQVGGAAASFQVIEMDVDGFKRFVRVVDDVTGATPSVTRSVSIVGKRA